MDGQISSVDPSFRAGEKENRFRNELDEVLADVNKEALPTTPAQAEPAGSHHSINFQEILTRMLHFLSTASNETLGATLAGLAAVTYLVLGRLGLLLIGIVGGVILHATWEAGGATQLDAQAKVIEITRRREASLDIVQRVLDWRKHEDTHDLAEKEETGKGNVNSQAQESLDFSGFQPATRAALTNLTDAVIRDYVKYVFIQLLERYSLCLDGGMSQFCPTTVPFRQLASRPSPDFYFQFLPTFRAKDLPMPFWNSSLTLHPLLSFFLMNYPAL